MLGKENLSALYKELQRKNKLFNFQFFSHCNMIKNMNLIEKENVSQIEATYFRL